MLLHARLVDQEYYQRQGLERNLGTGVTDQLQAGGVSDDTTKKPQEVSNSDDINEITKSFKTQVEKHKWIDRANKFAKKYFDGDIRQMTYCLKDVDAWKTWVDLKRDYMEVPWDDFYEESDNTKVGETVACAGGACEVVKM